jgi:hypothetical protein
MGYAATAPPLFQNFSQNKFSRLGAVKTPDEEGVTIYHVTLSGEKHPIPWLTFLGSPGSRNITREKTEKFRVGSAIAMKSLDILDVLVRLPSIIVSRIPIPMNFPLR